MFTTVNHTLTCASKNTTTNNNLLFQICLFAQSTTCQAMLVIRPGPLGTNVCHFNPS